MDRKLLLGATLAVMVALSGCAALTGGPLTFNASKATVAPGAVSTAGYRQVDVQSQTINRSFSVAGQNRTVTVTNWVATYASNTTAPTGQPLGSVVVLSSPAVSVAGQSLNPIGHLSDAQLIDMAIQQYGGTGDVKPAGNESMTILGHDTTVSNYRTTVDADGQQVDVTVHLATLQDGGDYLVVVGIHPTAVSAEQAGMRTMFTGVQHASG